MSSSLQKFHFPVEVFPSLASALAETSKNVADTTIKVMNSNLLNVFRFTELEKILDFLLEVRYYSKITHIKTKGVVIYHDNNSGNHVFFAKRLT